MAQQPRITLIYDPNNLAPIFAYYSLQKREYSIEQYLHVRDQLRHHIEIYGERNIPDKMHARLIVKNLPENYREIFRNLKFITTERTEVLTKLIESNKIVTAKQLIEQFNTIRKHVNWPRNV